jgi:hypothetical protein
MGSPHGRQKGVKNLLTRRVSETAQRLGIDPFEILLRFAAGDWRGLGYKRETHSEGFTIEPAVRARAAEQVAQYILPKLRSIEQTKPSALEGMTPEQRLEAMKHAVKLLEAHIKPKISSDG